MISPSDKIQMSLDDIIRADKRQKAPEDTNSIRKPFAKPQVAPKPFKTTNGPFKKPFNAGTASKKVQIGRVAKKTFKPAFQKPQNLGKRGFQNRKPRFGPSKAKKNIADRLSVNLADRLTCANRKN